MAIVHVSEKTFEKEVLQSEKPVLVDFWATWCGPCQMLGPVLEELAAEHPEIKVCKVDVDANMNLALSYKVSTIPMLLVFKDGKISNSSVGFQSKEELLSLV